MSAKAKQSVSDHKHGNVLFPEIDIAKLKPNKHLLHLSVVRQLSNQRRGTAKVKTRSEVRGGGAKPWTQKGTGRARAGSIRSPLWVGGGVSHGPSPRSYKTDLPKKARDLALAQAINSKQNETTLIKDLPKIDNAKTKNLINIVKSSSWDKYPLLIVASSEESNFTELVRASRNVPSMSVNNCDFLNVFDVLKANFLVITEKALGKIKGRIKNKEKSQKGSKK